MECRTLDLTINYANDLRQVRRIFKMKVYAKVFDLSSDTIYIDDMERIQVLINGIDTTEKRTPVDKHGQTNPAWNYTMKYVVGDSSVEHYGTVLVIKLYCKRKLGDRYIGEVHKSLKDLYEYACTTGGSAVVCYPVLKGSIESQGQLCFSYRFGDKVSIEKLMLADSIASFLLTDSSSIA
ncbi:protein SRC2-like [Rutidosis leptorrhynchoides]|uniref:protein SRC2-like n=1 Tax=Rutidosis leptorrhynchoides TaxID=125765 RepID=UPI003A99FF0D